MIRLCYTWAGGSKLDSSENFLGDPGITREYSHSMTEHCGPVREILNWCKEQEIDVYTEIVGYTSPTKNNGSMFVFDFKHQKDAVLFKMTWE